MEERIKELLSLGQIQNALDLLVKLDSGAILLASRFNTLRKTYNHGLIDFSEYSRGSAQISYAILESLIEIENNKRIAPLLSNSQTVWIAHNSKDNQTANQIKTYLSNRDIYDIKNLTSKDAGDRLKAFVANKAIKAQFLLVLCSTNSLSEGWTGLEQHLDILSNSLTQRNVIPLLLDDAISQKDVVTRVLYQIEEQLDQVEEDKPKENYTNNSSVNDLEPDRVSLSVLRNNLPKIVQRLRNASAVDISGEHFDSGMEKVLKTIRQTVERVAASHAY